MSRRAFTLFETLCVVVILAVLMAMTFSVSGPIRSAALESSAKNNLHQVYIALQLYREAQGGGNEFGTAAEMGMPDFTCEMKPFLAKGAVGDPAMFRSPCGDHPVEPNFAVDENTLLVYLANDDTWKRTSESRQGRTVVASDPNCNPQNVHITNPLVLSKYQVLRLDGSIRSESYLGLPSLVEYRR